MAYGFCQGYEEKKEPIFPSTYKAVQIAYLVEVAPTSVKSTLRVLQDMHSDGYLDEPVNTSGINFRGMDAEHQRMECASIRGKVERTLDGVHLDVVLAKFSWAEEKEPAALRMMEHIKPSLFGKAQDASMLIVNRLYCCPAGREKLSSYAIARKTGLAQTTVHKAWKIAKGISFGLEQEALKKLSPSFVAGGISRY
jgi:hypothetical protein